MTTSKFNKLASQATDIAVASPQVIAERLQRMARAGTNPSAKDLREFVGMGAEKILATQQAAMAMSIELTKAQYRRVMSVFTAKGMSTKRRLMQLVSPADMLRTSLDVMNEGLAPFRKKVVSNAKRLKHN